MHLFLLAILNCRVRAFDLSGYEMDYVKVLNLNQKYAEIDTLALTLTDVGKIRNDLIWVCLDQMLVKLYQSKPY